MSVVTCYAVATLDTRTLKVTDVGLYSSPSSGLTTVRDHEMYLDVCDAGSVDYHHAALAMHDWIFSRHCPRHLEWLRPFLRARVEAMGPPPTVEIVLERREPRR